MRNLLRFLVVLTALVLILSSCSGSASHTVTGTVYDTDFAAPIRFTGFGQPCESGASWQVVIENQSSRLLSAGPVATNGVLATAPTNGVYSCAVNFTLKGVGNANVYQIMISGHQPVDFTEAELAANHWDAAITVGP